jgi:hypothetical protein
MSPEAMPSPRPASGAPASSRDEVAASAGYAMFQTRRKRIECVFRCGKQHDTLRKTKHRGLAQVASDFLLNIIAYNLIRIPKLIAA